MNIDPSNVTWCDRHWLPYAKGAAYGLAATLLMIQCALTRRDFMGECGWDPQTGELATAEKINAAIHAHTPFCCYVGERVMDEILCQCLKPSKNGAPL